MREGQMYSQQLVMLVKWAVVLDQLEIFKNDRSAFINTSRRDWTLIGIHN